MKTGGRKKKRGPYQAPPGASMQARGCGGPHVAGVFRINAKFGQTKRQPGKPPRHYVGAAPGQAPALAEASTGGNFPLRGPARLCKQARMEAGGGEQYRHRPGGPGGRHESGMNGS